MASAGRRFARAFSDKKGLSSLEYALMASCGAMVLIVSYEAFFTRMGQTLADMFP